MGTKARCRHDRCGPCCFNISPCGDENAYSLSSRLSCRVSTYPLAGTITIISLRHKYEIAFQHTPLRGQIPAYCIVVVPTCPLAGTITLRLCNPPRRPPVHPPTGTKARRNASHSFASSFQHTPLRGRKLLVPRLRRVAPEFQHNPSRRRKLRLEDLHLAERRFTHPHVGTET